MTKHRSWDRYVPLSGFLLNSYWLVFKLMSRLFLLLCVGEVRANARCQRKSKENDEANILSHTQQVQQQQS